MPNRISRPILLCATLLASLTGTALAVPAPSAQPLVRGAVIDTVTLPLVRDQPGALAASRDEGAVNANAFLPHVHLELARPAASQAALDALARQQHVRGAVNYHRWLTPAALRSYGPAQADIDQVAAWLRRRGLSVNGVSPSGMSIDFAGSAGAVGAAFHTQLHNVLHNGEAHVANVTAPAIPSALAPVVSGVTLANFFPKPQMRRRTPALTIPTNPPYYAVSPVDFATIYNVKPLRGSGNLYGSPVTGAGTTIAVVEQTKILSADWYRFRHVFGLSGYGGTLSLTHPGGCTSPGYTPDEGEAALDAEWSSAVAPSAHIIEASCAGTAPFEFGVMTALRNLVEVGTPATIFSISYGGPEVANGFGFASAWTNLVEEGAVEGKAIFVSTGDYGVSADGLSATNPSGIDSDGLYVNGLSDTAYNVAVGGTDFLDTALGQNATYWNAGNSTFGGSAKSYVPETPWNNSCASSVLRDFLGAGGAIAFCNSKASLQYVQNGIGGSSSQSVYYTKPDWQLTSVLGVPNDGVRDQPDVSLFAGNGIWGHFYVYCMSDANEGGAPCDYTNTNDLFGNAAGGTSFAAPAFAGIAALVQQAYDKAFATSTPLGNPAPVLYALAKAQFTTPLGFSQCNSTLGNKISSACIFQYVTVGDNAEPCYAGTPACVTSADSKLGIGVLGAVVGGKHEFAYPAQPGYSLTTGLGSVNVTNLVYGYFVGL